MHHFSENLRILWYKWEIRILVLVSFFLQIILALFGSRRKRIAKIWIRIVVWVAYMAADWVAVVALGNIAANCPCAFATYSRELSNELQALWAAVLLVHLGGPDNITAYSLQDNELWLRHLLELVVQVAIAFYVLVSSRANTFHIFVAVPMFIIGFVRYVERTLVLWSLSPERFVASQQDPRPELVEKAMEKRNGRGSDQLYNAFFLFTRFARLFAGQILHDKEAIKSYQILHQKPAEDAFYMVAVELEIVYDMLYTKASFVFSNLGIIVRCISFIFLLSILLAFAIISDFDAYLPIDITITYILLIGAVVLEFYGFIRHFFSDWAKLCSTKSRNIKRTTCDAICTSRPLFNNPKRWSKAMGQFNLVSYCIKDMPPGFTNGVLKFLRIKKFKHQYLHWKDVKGDVQLMILKKLKEKIEKNGTIHSDIELRRKVLAQRGELVPRESYGLGNRFNWCTTNVEFEYSLLVWHIATSICYHQDNGKDDPSREIGKYLSDYMMYLLVLCPSIMPKGIGELRFRETCTDIKNCLEETSFGTSHDPIKASNLLFEKGGVPAQVHGSQRDDAMSLRTSGCDLANQLQDLDDRNRLSCVRKWEMINEVWVEMLTYAAVQSGWREHIQQLKNGGELLTHIRVLMAHLGLSEQYRSYGRVIP